MDKTVKGLNFKWFTFAFIASLVGAVGIFLPYASVGKTSVSYIDMVTKSSSGPSWLAIIAVLAIILTAAMAIWNFVSPDVKKVRIWVAVAAIAAAFMMILLFASKSIIDGMKLASDKFLVKNLSWGYWICFIAIFASLAMAMKLVKINTGYIVLTILGVIWLFPIVWILLTAFREEQGYYVGYFVPKGFTLKNFTSLFSDSSLIPFGKWYMNTLIVAICSCVINTLIVLATSFVLSRTRFTGRKSFMKVLMIIGMFPGFMSMIAVYNILKGIGLNQSLLALIITGAAGAAMGYHVCKGFFDTIPKAMDEAATIDGATKWQIFTRITMPLSKSIIVYTVLCNFLGAWSDYIFPSMLFGDKQSSYTVAIGLKWMIGETRINEYYTQFAAGAVIVAIPIVVLFIWLQRFYVEGLSGSVKG